MAKAHFLVMVSQLRERFPQGWAEWFCYVTFLLCYRCCNFISYV